MYRIVREIHTEGDLPALLHGVLRESQGLIGCSASSLFLYDEEQEDLIFEVVVGGDEALRSLRIPLGEGIVGAAARERRTILVNDVATDPRHRPVGTFEVHNLIAAPMVANDRLVGVIEVLDKEGGFDALDAKILDILAVQAASQIELTRLLRERIAAERRAALGVTAAGIAHYIKNVLSQWKLSSTLVDHGLESDDLEVVRRAWPLLRRANARIGDLVENMLSVSKARIPERAPVDLNEVVVQILEGEQGRAADLGVTLRLALDPDLPLAHVDPHRIHEILVNLLANALDAHEEAGTEGAWVEVATAQVEGQARLRVADNGPGISPQVQGRMFEPFYSTKGRKGTGLGLALVEKTIEEHGGRIRVESPLEGGAILTVTLPLA